MNGIIIRRATVDDAAAICALESRYIDCPWTEEQIRSEIADPDAVFFTAERGGEAVGFLSGVFAADECEISNIAVREDARRRGIATALFDRLLHAAAERGTSHVFLLVREGNDPAAALYGRLGFEPVGVRKGYYAGADAIIMRRKL